MSKSSAWFLFLLAFVVVYREVFETILFYAALWSQGAHLAIIAGAGDAGPDDQEIESRHLQRLLGHGRERRDP